MSKPKVKNVVGVEKNSSKKPSLYHDRLIAEGVPMQPIVSEPKPIRQFQLAHLAATLARGADFEIGASEITARALQVWNAAGKTLVTAAQADVLVKGLLVMDRNDWEIHAEALIRSMDDIHGALPGHNNDEVIKQSRDNAKAKAGLAVIQACALGPENEVALKKWFPGKAETSESRIARFAELMEFAKKRINEPEELPWGTQDANVLKNSILKAWEPLSLDVNMWMDVLLSVADIYFTAPDKAKGKQGLATFPALARWFTVMRHDQLVAAKQRA